MSGLQQYWFDGFQDITIHVTRGFDRKRWKRKRPKPSSEKPGYFVFRGSPEGKTTKVKSVWGEMIPGYKWVQPLPLPGSYLSAMLKYIQVVKHNLTGESVGVVSFEKTLTVENKGQLSQVWWKISRGLKVLTVTKDSCAESIKNNSVRTCIQTRFSFDFSIFLVIYRKI